MKSGLGVVTFASSVILALAQLQSPLHQYASISNLAQLHQTNSEDFMRQSANIILNQDNSFPLNPGFLTGSPVHVNEATQSILNQEAKIVGYNTPPGLLLVPPHLQQNSAQRFIPRASRNQQGRSRIQRPSQSLTIPLLSHAQQRPANVVPVRTVGSLRNLLHPAKNEQSTTYSSVRKVKKQPTHSPKIDYVRVETYSSTVSPNKVYHDISPDHPVPPPPSGQRDPLRNPFNFRSQNTDVRQSSHEIDSRHPVPTQNDNDINGMRPPPPLSDETHVGSSERQYTRSRDYTREQSSRESVNDRTSSKQEMLRESVNKLLRSGEEKEIRQSSQGDSASQSSERFYQQSSQPSQPHYSYNQKPTGYSGGGGYDYSGNSRGIVHRHVFVHAAPEEPSYGPKVRIIRPAMEPEKHVQLIFVKTPTPPPQPQTIIELPQNPPQKTVVYVLAKKPEEGSNDVRVIKPHPTKPVPPEIYFIRYGDQRKHQGYPVANLQSLYDNYGAYSQSSEHSSNPGLSLRSKRNKDGLDTYAPLSAYSTSGQINEISNEEAEFRRTNLDAFF